MLPPDFRLERPANSLLFDNAMRIAKVHPGVEPGAPVLRTGSLARGEWTTRDESPTGRASRAQTFSAGDASPFARGPAPRKSALRLCLFADVSLWAPPPGGQAEPVRSATAGSRSRPCAPSPCGRRRGGRRSPRGPARGPPRPVSGHRVRLLAGHEALRRGAAALGVEALEELPSLDAAAGAVPLAGGDALALEDPLAALHHLGARQSALAEVALEHTGDLLHGTSLPSRVRRELRGEDSNLHEAG